MNGPLSAGAVYALLAYTAWGLSPLFWRELGHLPPLYVLAQRVLWGGLVFGALLIWRGRAREFLPALRSRSFLVLGAAALLLAFNWFVYLLAVWTGRVLDASLGYFINPLLNVVLGMLFLGERLRRLQWMAVLLAVVAVAMLAGRAEHFPWIALALAGSFGLYGLLRKTVRHDALLGSNLEMLFMVPWALPILLRPAAFDAMPGALDAGDHLLLLATGLQTALPLLWFSHAARRLPLSTLGFFQYIAPSLQFLLAVFWFGEAFDQTRLASFALIWLALALMTVESRRHRRHLRRLAAAGPDGAPAA